MSRRESRQWPHEELARGYLLLFAASIFLVVGSATPGEFRAVGAEYLAVIPLSLGALSAAWQSGCSVAG
jgi:hypothetical protein